MTGTDLNIGAGNSSGAITNTSDSATTGIQEDLSTVDMTESRAFLDQLAAMSKLNVAVQMESQMISFQQSMFTSIERNMQWK